jgi:YjbE family integral membrane protein
VNGADKCKAGFIEFLLDISFHGVAQSAVATDVALDDVSIDRILLDTALQKNEQKIIGGILLIYIGVQLMAEGDDDDSIESSSNIFQAIKTILIADLVMSLDNVVAVAAAAEKAPEEFRMPLILLGLAMSIPLIIFASTLLLKVMERYPIIITIGAALLGYLAGEMFVTDPAVTDTLHSLMDHPNIPFQILGILLVVGIGGLLKKKHAKSE